MVESLVTNIALVINAYWLLYYFLKFVLVDLSATLSNTFKQLRAILVDMMT